MLSAQPVARVHARRVGKVVQTWNVSSLSPRRAWVWLLVSLVIAGLFFALAAQTWLQARRWPEGAGLPLEHPLANLNLTSHGFMHAVRGLKGLQKPWLALGGGGYNMSNVARCWTLAWAEISGQEAPEMLPPGFFADQPGQTPKGLTVHHSDRNLHGRRWQVAKEAADEVIAFHRRTTFPVLGVRV